MTYGGHCDLGEIHWQIGFHGEENLNSSHAEKDRYLQFWVALLWRILLALVSPAFYTPGKAFF